MACKIIVLQFMYGLPVIRLPQHASQCALAHHVAVSTAPGSRFVPRGARHLLRALCAQHARKGRCDLENSGRGRGFSRSNKRGFVCRCKPGSMIYMDKIAEAKPISRSRHGLTRRAAGHPLALELSETAKLALPMVLTQFGQIVMMTADLAFIRRIGAEALAAAALAGSMYQHGLRRFSTTEPERVARWRPRQRWHQRRRCAHRNSTPVAPSTRSADRHLAMPTVSRDRAVGRVSQSTLDRRKTPLSSSGAKFREDEPPDRENVALRRRYGMLSHNPPRSPQWHRRPHALSEF